MKVAIESYGGVKGCYATVAEIQDSFQSMTKHKCWIKLVLLKFTRWFNHLNKFNQLKIIL